VTDPRDLLRRYGLRPSKAFGQHFLVAEWVYERILEAAELTPEDLVLEVGAGLGSLTLRLAARAGHVLAVELDRHLMAILGDVLADEPNVHLVQGDILRLEPTKAFVAWLGPEIVGRGYQVVANLPYGVAARVLRHLLDRPDRPTRLTVMVQREVAERIVAPPGKTNVLGLSVRLFGEPRLVCRVPPGAFYPPPRVSSAVLRIDVYPTPRLPAPMREIFFQLVNVAFRQKRKQIHNSLSHGLGFDAESVGDLLARAGIAPQVRPQHLDLEAWIRLAQALAVRRGIVDEFGEQDPPR